MSIFSGARKVVINNSQLTSQVSDKSKGAGLERLRAASILGAAHDSSERYPPPICHPGTRQNYIENLTGWGLNTDHHAERITWVKGPAGVGKSAVAQSCAEALGDKLGASFFFSRPNHRDDPDRFFTSLAYQLAEKFSHYGAVLDKEIHRRPSLVTKALPHQFRDFFVTPFSNATVKKEMGERVIIVDGLDECARKEAQEGIIKIVAESVRVGTNPFLWIFLSRLEPQLVTTFNLPDITSVSRQIDLPVSRKIDQEILLYLADKLQEIGCGHHLPLPWPSEGEVWALVDFSAGLFACAHAIILFISTDSRDGPVGLLRVVLELAKRSTMRAGKHPLSALDELYTLVMERVPPEILEVVRWILLVTRMPGMTYADTFANLLALSESQFRNACLYLHSVMALGQGYIPTITFYHASFMDFLEDPIRSGGFCIWTDCAVTLLEEVICHLDQVQVGIDINGQYFPRFNPTWPHKYADNGRCYGDHLRVLFKLLCRIRLSDDTQKHHALKDFDFRKLAFRPYSELITPSAAETVLLWENLDSRLKLLRPSVLRNWRSCFLPKSVGFFYIIGDGKKRALLEEAENNSIWIRPYSPRLSKKLAKQLSEKSEKSKNASST